MLSRVEGLPALTVITVLVLVLLPSGYLRYTYKGEALLRSSKHGAVCASYGTSVSTMPER